MSSTAWTHAESPFDGPARSCGAVESGANSSSDSSSSSTLYSSVISQTSPIVRKTEKTSPAFARPVLVSVRGLFPLRRLDPLDLLPLPDLPQSLLKLLFAGEKFPPLAFDLALQHPLRFFISFVSARARRGEGRGRTVGVGPPEVFKERGGGCLGHPFPVVSDPRQRGADDRQRLSLQQTDAHVNMRRRTRSGRASDGRYRSGIRGWRRSRLRWLGIVAS